MYHLIYLFALLGYTQAFESYKVFDTLSKIPSGWEQTSSVVDPSTLIELQIYIVEQNELLFEETLIGSSTPGSPSYGQYMEQSDIEAMVRPLESDFATVESWLQSNGLSTNEGFETDEESITFTVTIAQAESLLQTNYQIFQYNGTEELLFGLSLTVFPLIYTPLST
ncbi:hypothetical protein H072_2350 [Dactylellina haptotyla CBS 200.50]|uniref:Peptidase S53 activation domain-containing protein n=1 Tax=Dactylellina haptotyla (strain CBS 200.50) TaxID=1284197 RepID=S8ARM7_DACHA|nr:hypothetical protein H072_2350 [Dactylellina haptotyla CBS 200.50]